MMWDLKNLSPEQEKKMRIAKRLVATTVILFIGYSLVNASAEQRRMRQNLIELCASKGLDAIDLEPPHTPKCLNLTTGIMTVPPDLYTARGGRM